MSAHSQRAERCFRLLAPLALFAAFVSALGIQPAAARGDVAFYISDSISEEDAMYIREGVRFAQDYIAETLEIDLDRDIIVNASPAPPRDGSSTVGLSTGNSMVLYTGAEGWKSAAPFLRVQTVVHEFVHVVQQVVAGDEGDAAPAWIHEGSADFLGYQAVIDAGWVSEQDVEDYVTSWVLYGEQLPPLADVENIASYQDQPANIYNLAYLAVERLTGGDPRAIGRFYERLGDGADWQAAFRSSFKTSPDDFYDEFEESRATFAAPYDEPAPFTAYGIQEYPAHVEIAALPGTIERGEQLIVIAQSDAWISCDLRVHTRSDRTLVEEPSFADTTGKVIWLWSVPADLPGARVTAEISCGGNVLEEPFQIT